MQGDAGHDLPLLRPHPDFQPQQLVGLFHARRLEDARRPQLDLREIGVFDHRHARRRGRRGRRGSRLARGSQGPGGRGRVGVARRLDAREQAAHRSDFRAGLRGAPHDQALGQRLDVLHAQHLAHLAHLAGHDRVQQAADDAEHVAQRVQHVAERGGVALLGEAPRLARLDGPVALAQGGGDGRQSRIDAQGLHGAAHDGDGRHGLLAEGLLVRPQRLLRGGDAAVAIGFDHLDPAAEQVAQVVGEVGVDPADERLLREAGVLPEHHLGHEEIAERVDPVFGGHFHGVDRVAGGLAHLGIAHQPPAVGEDGPRHRQIHGLEHGGPVDGVGGQDVLPDQVARGRPPAVELLVVPAVPHGADVVDERVEPDVADEVAVERQLDAPREPALRPGDAQVLERLAQEAEGLVAAEVGLDERGILIDVADQPLLVLAHAEKVIGLADLFHVAPAIGTGAPGQVLLHEEPLARHAVPAVVLGPVDLAPVEQVLQDFLHHDGVTGLGGADEVVIRDAELGPQFLEADHRGVGLLLGGHAGLHGGLLNLLAVLVGAGQEPGRHPEQAVIPGQHIAQDGRVGMPDVRLVVDVIDRRGDIKLGRVHEMKIAPRCRKAKKEGVQGSGFRVQGFKIQNRSYKSYRSYRQRPA